MRWTTIALAVATLCLAPPLTARTWEAGFVVRDDESTGVLRSWDQTFGLSAGLTLPLARSLELASRLTTRIGWFDRYEGACPYCAGFGCGCAFDGVGLRTLEGTFTLRGVGGTSVKRFVGLCGGVLVADVGKVTRTIRFVSRPDDPRFDTVEGTGKITFRALFGLAAGTIFRGRDHGLGVGFEGSATMATDRSTLWFQLAYLVEFR